MTTTTRTDRLEELHHRLTRQTMALISGDDWRAMLEIAGRFHRYSAHNIFLIQAQFPTATRVAGYRRWASLGRQVRSGETGIAILAPCVSRIRPGDDTTDEDPLEPKRMLRGFRVVYVFDESQTDGAALPDLRAHLFVGGDTAKLCAGLERLIAGAGFTVRRGYCAGANGVTDFSARTVTVRSDVDDLQATKTLCHELAHCLLHDPRPDPIPRNRAEVEAESVAYVVCQFAGMATTDYSLPYLARWSCGDASLIVATAERALGAARLILDGLGLDGNNTDEPSKEMTTG
jgi:hypothetical protein